MLDYNQKTKVITNHTLQTRHLLNGILFLVSTSIIALTFNIFIIGIWVLLWVFAGRYATHTKGMGFLIFYFGIYLFYPTSSSAFHTIHSYEIVLSGTLLVFVAMHRFSALKYLKGYPVIKFVFYGWIIWGVLVYSCILYVNYIHDLIFDIPYKESPFGLITLMRDSTMLTIVIPAITAAFAMLLPVFALRNVKDFESFRVALGKFMLFLLVFSLIRYIFNIEFIPNFDEEIRFDGFRMGAFSATNPNGFGRLLIFPFIFFSSLAIYCPSKLRRYEWVTIFLMILCIMLTFSRTTYISSLTGLLVLFLLHIRKIKNNIIFILLIFLLITIIFTQLNLNKYFEPETGRTSTGGVAVRLLMYKAAYEIISSNPLFGAFPGGHQIAKSKLDIPGLIYGSAHNMFLNVAVEWGLPMGILLLLALFLAFWNGIRTIQKKRHIYIKQLYWVKAFAYAIIAISVAYLIHGITENVAPYFVFFILGLSIAARRLLSFQQSGFYDK